MLSDALKPEIADSLVIFAETLADLAARQTVPRFRQSLSVKNKASDDNPFDPVTEADQQAEAAIRHHIEAVYPDHEIDGEEYGLKKTGSSFRWVLDPVDGTRAFIAGLVSWGTLIALQYQGRPIIGIIDQPVIKERYIGVITPTERYAEKGATLNGRYLKTRRLDRLSDGIFSTTDPYLFTHGQECAAFDAVRQQARLTRFGLDCYAYARLAAGGLDLILESGLQTYDRMALIPVVRGAGGVCVNWQGGPAETSEQVVALGDPRHLDALVSLLKGSS